MVLAEAVHRGRDGSIHYLASSPTGSQLIITDPVLGVRRLGFDGPVVRASNTGSVEYESIGSSGSTTVIVSPGHEPNITWIGICTYCAFPPIGHANRGHDFQLWPYCPWADRDREPESDQNVVPLPARSEPVAEPAPRPSTGTGDAQAVPSPGTQSAPRVPVVGVDPQYTPASEEPVTSPEIRWGGPAGGW
jgi:hypothetical protein